MNYLIDTHINNNNKIIYLLTLKKISLIEKILYLLKEKL